MYQNNNRNFRSNRGFSGASRYSNSGNRAGGSFGSRPNPNRRRFKPQPRKMNFTGDFDANDFMNHKADKSEWNIQEVNTSELTKIADLKVDPRLVANLQKKGFATLTPIQHAVIPVINQGQEVVGLANTGTGKTAAFLIPIINTFAKTPGTAMIIAPTRELAQQIEQEFFNLARGMNMRSALVIGGASMGRQAQELAARPNFIIGTPGRIKDFVKRGNIRINNIKFFVLDEADRMLDMGFVADIRLLLSQKMPDAKTYFFSATLDKKVSNLLKEFSKDPQIISVITAQTAQTIKQTVTTYTDDNDKVRILSSMLTNPEFQKTLIFSRTKHGADRLQKRLSQAGIRADVIHGDKRQSQRERTLRAFRDNKVQHLVATDVAARGLDIHDVTHVINFDQPTTKEDYVHRIGRTGRAGKEGHAITFVKK